MANYVSDGTTLYIDRSREPVALPTTTDPIAAAIANATALTAKGQAALAANTTFLAIASPTQAQAITQTKALTRQVNGLIRQLLGLLDSVSDV